MSIFRKKRVMGILILSIGAGIILAITVPTIGWVLFSGIALVCIGVYMLRC